MTHARLAAVLGATRGQGLSVINALMQSSSPRYTIRGLTQDASTPGAEQLRARGIDLRETNLDDPGAIKHAFTGVDVIFAVTTMYDGDISREVQQGKNIADSAADTPSLEHFIWSTLPSASTVSKGKVPVPHMDGKAQVDEYIIKSLPKLAEKTTFYWGGLYAENVTYPSWQPTFTQSEQRMAWIQPVSEGTIVPFVGDHSLNTGIFVRRVLLKQGVCRGGRYVLGVVDWLTMGEVLRIWKEVKEEKEGKAQDIVYIKADLDEIGNLWPGPGKELGQMLCLSELLGKRAWSKNEANLITKEDMELVTGDEEGELMRTAKAIKKLAEKA